MHLYRNVFILHPVWSFYKQRMVLFLQHITLGSVTNRVSLSDMELIIIILVYSGLTKIHSTKKSRSKLKT
jgi:hypothetical protein